MDKRTRNAIGIPRASRNKDMEKAILTASHPKDSKFGECLINVNTKQDPLLNSKLKKIRSEMHRMKHQANQMRDHFVRKSQVLNYEPMILVERPPSSSFKYEKVPVQGLTLEEVEDLEKPGYMRRLKSMCKTPAKIPTIDAFTKRVSKKRNVWEEGSEKTPFFTSTVRPFSRLNDDEINDLKHGWNYHKPQYSEDTSGKQTVSITGEQL